VVLQAARRRPRLESAGEKAEEMKFSKALKAEIEADVAKWREKLLLQVWTFRIDYSDKPSSDDDSAGQVSADIACDTKRRRGTITIYPYYATFSRERRQNCIVHELCHCIADEMNYLLWRMQSDHHVSLDERICAWEHLTEHIKEVAMRLEKK